jgi:hypothetical protein
MPEIEPHMPPLSQVDSIVRDRRAHRIAPDPLEPSSIATGDNDGGVEIEPP